MYIKVFIIVILLNNNNNDIKCKPEKKSETQMFLLTFNIDIA